MNPTHKCHPTTLLIASMVVLDVCYQVACSVPVPRGECTGELVYLDGSCRPCPDDARFDHALGSCVCLPEEVYEYRPDNTCALRADAAAARSTGEHDAGADDAGAAAPDAGAAAEGGDACAGYCGFVDGCLAQNAAATAAAPAVIEQLGVVDEDPAGCLDRCQGFTDADSEKVAACIAAGRADAECDDKDDIPGIQAAIELIDGCCLSAPDSGLCRHICQALEGAPTARSMVRFCD